MLPFERIHLVGATGAVGREALAILGEWGVPASRVVAYASPRSGGARVPYGEEEPDRDGGWDRKRKPYREARPYREGEPDREPEVELRTLNPDAFGEGELALFCTGAEVSREWVPRAAAAGALVVDSSSAFRMDPAVPLVIPEVNGELLGRPGRAPRIVANPNCSTILLLVALDPLRRAFGVRRIDVATYQAVSGAGAAGIDELARSAGAALRGQPFRPEVFPEPPAFNVFSHDSPVDPDTGVNGEEAKIIAEVRRIWEAPDLAVSPTCVRVGVFRGHAEAVTVTLDEPVTDTEVREVLAGAPGVRIVDDRSGNRFPTPREADGKDAVLVGRIRPDPSDPPDRGRHARCCLFLAGDQLRKGAALNALQIAAGLGG